MKLLWLARAQRDRQAQIGYVAAYNPAAAVRLGDELMSHIGRLIEHPELGRRGRVAGTRELVIPRSPYIAVYRVKSKSRRIEVIRVLHGAQRWP